MCQLDSGNSSLGFINEHCKNQLDKKFTEINGLF